MFVTLNMVSRIVTTRLWGGKRVIKLMKEWRYSITHYERRHQTDVERSPSGPCRFNPAEKATSTYRVGGWVGTTAGLQTVEGDKKISCS